MFSWASKDYILDQMTWKQVIYYYNVGWETKQTEAKVHWGTYGQLMSEGQEQHSTKKVRPDIEEIRSTYPGYENAYYDERGRLIRG